VAGAQYAKNENPVDYHHIHGKARKEMQLLWKKSVAGFSGIFRPSTESI
jgi:hypothetical protein